MESIKMGKEKIINMFFGNTPKQRFKRAIILLCAIAGMVFICLQVSCGFDRKGNFYFSVNPAANVDIEVKK